jgi:hypothetical protein
LRSWRPQPKSHRAIFFAPIVKQCKTKPDAALHELKGINELLLGGKDLPGIPGAAALEREAGLPPLWERTGLSVEGWQAIQVWQQKDL